MEQTSQLMSTVCMVVLLFSGPLMAKDNLGDLRLEVGKAQQHELIVLAPSSTHQLLIVHQNTDVSVQLGPAGASQLYVQPGHEENSELFLLKPGSGEHRLVIAHRYPGAPNGEVWFEKVAIDESEVPAWQALIEVSNVYARGDKALALARIEQVLSMHQSNTHQYLARAMYMKAIMAYELSLYHYALDTFQTMYRKRLYFSRYQQSYAHAYTGRTHYLLTDYEASVEVYQKANLLLDPVKDRKAMASNLNNIGLSYHRRGLLHEAKSHYQQAGDIYQELGFTSMAARHQINMGGVNMMEGDFRQAEERFHKAMKLADQLEDPSIHFDALEMQAWLKQTRGLWQSLLLDWEQVLRFHEQQPGKAGAIRANRLLGTVYNSLGAYRQALAHLEVAEAYKKLGSAQAIYRPFYAHKLSQVWQAIKAWDTGRLSALVHDMRLLKADLNVVQDQTLLLHQMGVALQHLGHLQQAQGLLLQAYRQNLNKQNRYLASVDALSLSQVMLDQLAAGVEASQADGIRQTWHEVMTNADLMISELDVPSLRSRWQLLQASFHKLNKDTELANEVLLVAERLAKEQLDHASLLGINRLRIELDLIKDGLTPATQARLIGLVKEGLESKNLVTSPLLRSRFNTNLNDVTALLISSLIQQQPVSEQALVQALYWSEQLKAQSLRDLAGDQQPKSMPAVNASLAEHIDELGQLHLAIESLVQRGESNEQAMLELHNQINRRTRSIEHLLSDQPGKTDTKHREMSWYADVQSRLGPGQLVVAVRQLDEQWVIWLLDAQGVRHRLLAAGNRVSEQVSQVRAYFKAPKYGLVRMPADIQQLISQLGRQLVGDLDLTAYGELILSPHGPWQGFPINALRLDERMAHLDMSLTPSLLMRSVKPEQRPKRQLLLVSQPAYRTDLSGRSLAALPRSAAEAEHLMRVYGTDKTTRLMAEQANKTAVLQALSQPHQVAHLATHGLFSEQIPELTGLALASPQRPYELLSVSEIITAEINVDQVVLSACETGLGEAIIDEGLISVGYAFLAGGAREVYATLWPIGDDKAYQDVKKMYQRSVNNGDVHLTTSDPAWVRFKFL